MSKSVVNPHSYLRKTILIISIFMLSVVLMLYKLFPSREIPALRQIRNFGANPSNLEMYLYVPDGLPLGIKPPVLVAIHWCTGSGPVFFSNTEYRELADKFKFVVVYPSVTRTYGNRCYDVGGSDSLVHGAGGDSLGIVSMVKYVVVNLGADQERVYVTGLSASMSTQMMLGAYPEVFKAGSAFAGVPFSCMKPYDEPESLWQEKCATGNKRLTPAEWGDLVRGAYPEYIGLRPRVQLWHGTEDDVVYFNNHIEATKQWIDVLCLNATGRIVDFPQINWERSSFKDKDGNIVLQTISVIGVGHNVLVNGMALHVIKFFGLDQSDGNI
ncbi:hypothetical protein HK096_006839 [Nowakowskiella sp. JEL0078]|nr:hypothetical protein HK096_006839 [Nowakowskiella sp. JEL0078]